MSSLKYVGRNPDSDSSLVTKSYADTRAIALAVTEAYVNSQVALQDPILVKEAYVDASDLQRAKKTDVDTADGNYIPLTQIGATGGVATIRSDGLLVDSQIPSGVTTERKILFYDSTTEGIGTMILGSSHTCTSTGLREFLASTIEVPDPGYPWRPLAFAVVYGDSSSGTNPGNRFYGNGNQGQMAVMGTSGSGDTVFSAGICTSTWRSDYHICMPFASQNATPLTTPAVNGALELGLYLSCFSGSTYTFYNTNFLYYVVVVPSV